MAKPTKETLRHSQAFEFYYLLGQDRSLEAVARKFSVSPSAAHGWSMAFSWARRVEERDREMAVKLAERLKSGM